MHTTIPLAVAGLLAVGISIIGTFYILSPERIMGGLRPETAAHQP